MVHTHKQLVVNMLIHSFAENKRIRRLVRKPNHSQLSALFSYVYEQIRSTGHFFMSENKSTIVLYHQASAKGITLRTSMAICRLILCSSWPRLISNYRINKIVNSTRAAQAQSSGYRDYFYIWFLARREGIGNYKGLLDLITHLKEKSANHNLPLFLETICPRMKRIYERAGFQFYETKEIDDLTIHFGHMTNKH